MQQNRSFTRLPRDYFGAIYADPPWRFETWSKKGRDRSPDKHYQTMELADIERLDIASLAHPSGCALFLWASWPMLDHALWVIDNWGFTYKTCAFAWVKVNKDGITPSIGTGYWTRANSEVCLLATIGKPKRKHADVRQAIIESAREHSRKPDCVYERIERLVSGPYLELFARTRRKGWESWGKERGKFK